MKATWKKIYCANGTRIIIRPRRGQVTVMTAAYIRWWEKHKGEACIMKFGDV